MTEERHMHHHPYGPVKPSFDQCERHMHYHVIVSLEDGSSFDGIIINVSGDDVTILISEDVILDENDRQYYEDYGGYGGYARPRRRARRFRRRVFPLAALAGLALYPYFQPYPPYYPYY